MVPPGLHVVERAGPTDQLPVVLVHGAPDRAKNFAAVLELLGDLAVITYDRRGYGRSVDARPVARDFADHAADLIAILAGRRAVIVAQSVGCNVAMAAAARAPDLVAALGVWEPPNAWCDWWPDPALRETATAYAEADDPDELGEQFNRKILGDERWDSLTERTRRLLRAEGAAFRADMAAELRAPFDFAEVVAPTVIGFGTATSSGHADGARRLARIMDADLFVVPGGDHFAPISRPSAWARLVRLTVARSAT
jgi:pimeloyl-ACP methyl ester carboxylesterase